MKKDKVCIDIGGTKTIFAVLNKNLKVKISEKYPTPKERSQFIKTFETNLRKFRTFSSTANVSIAGRVDKDGKVILCPHLPIIDLNIKKLIEKHFKKVCIDNDANCFAIYEILRGALRKVKDGVIIVWGTGIGGSIVINKKIYGGKGLASEIGHMKNLLGPKEDADSIIGGGGLKKTSSYSGLELNNMAKAGDLYAIETFLKIGGIFGRFLSSIAYMLDPEIIIIGGSFVNSWKFMKDAVNEVIKKETVRGKLKIKTVRGNFYAIKSCYFLDEYENLNNKL
jgi:predicted NBD/HSP70 family sugar kinase